MKSLLLLLNILWLCAATAQEASNSPSLTDQKLIEANQYLTGIGGTKDRAKALSIYSELAAAGEPRAMNALGIMYKEGIGIKRDRQQAIFWLTKGGQAGYAQSWYNLGLIYKDAVTEKERDYSRAYAFFCKAAGLGDAQSVYAKAYMLYKGLGCEQDYAQSARLFAGGALLGRPNSMYFYGLCLRNGYGVARNTDSATYWLTKAAAKGYSMAEKELASPAPENSNAAAKELASTVERDIRQAQENALNRFRKLEPEIRADKIEGMYEGFVIKYDWSGKHAVSSNALKLVLRYQDGVLSGSWSEEGLADCSLRATLTQQSLIFSNTSYGRKDHYSPDRDIKYNFNDARLEWITQGDSVLLAGNIHMFSPSRNEPQKPVFISLIRKTSDSSNQSLIRLSSEDGKGPLAFSSFNAYPNPFTSVLTADFKIERAAEVQVQLLTMDGKPVYSNRAGLLSPGYYRLPISPSKTTPGTYLLKLSAGSGFKTLKVIRL